MCPLNEKCLSDDVGACRNNLTVNVGASHNSLTVTGFPTATNLITYLFQKPYLGRILSGLPAE